MIDNLREKLSYLRLTVWKQTNLNGQANLDHDSVEEVLALIRTEKLKLLDEVRKRVVGEHKPKTRGLTQNPNNAAYWTKASQAEFALIEQQLNNLAKREAEL